MKATFYLRGWESKLSGNDAGDFWAKMNRYADQYMQAIEFADFGQFERYLYICPDEFESANLQTSFGSVEFRRGVGGWQVWNS